MRILVVIILLSQVVFVFSQVPLEELRTCQQNVLDDSDYAEDLLLRIEGLNPKSNLEKGYWGLIESMMAEHTYNPMKKLSYFNNGKSKLEGAIEADSKSVELRYLRLGMQVNIPSFLGYKDNIEEDKIWILNHLNDQKNQIGTLYLKIIEFLLQSDICTQSEKETLEKLI